MGSSLTLSHGPRHEQLRSRPHAHVTGSPPLHAPAFADRTALDVPHCDGNVSSLSRRELEPAASSSTAAATRCGGSYGEWMAHGALLFAALLYSGWNILASLTLLTAHVDAIGFSLVRELCAIVLLYAWAAMTEPPLRWPDRSDRLQFAGLGLLLASFQLCFAFGVQLTNAQTAALFQCIEPTTAALLAALLRTERLRGSTILSALLAGAGVATMELSAPAAAAAAAGAAVAKDKATTGVSRAVGCALLFCQGVGIGGYCILQGRLLKRPAALHRTADEHPPHSGRDLGVGQTTAAMTYGPVTVIAHAYVGSLLVMLCAVAALSAARGFSDSPLSRSSLGELLQPLPLIAVGYAVVFASCVGYSLRAWANTRLTASTLVLYNAVQPPLTAALSFALGLRSMYGVADVLGTALVTLAVVVAARGDGCAQRLAESSARLRAVMHRRLWVRQTDNGFSRALRSAEAGFSSE